MKRTKKPGIVEIRTLKDLKLIRQVAEKELNQRKGGYLQAWAYGTDMHSQTRRSR